MQAVRAKPITIKALGLKVEHEWRATPNDRDIHETANGQRQPLDAPHEREPER